MKRKNNIKAFPYLLPALVSIIAVTIVPIIYTIFISFTNYNMYHLDDFSMVGLKNYLDVCSGSIKDVFLPVLGWTLVFAILSTFGSYFTGLIHDCAKCLPNNEMQKALSECVLVCGEADNPKTHHAPAGVVIAKKEFGVNDEEILSAIRWHTIGKLNMSLFEKIIFLADKIETGIPETAPPQRLP